MDRSANLLGALALAVVDEQTRRMQTASGLGPSASAALVTLGEYPGTTIGALADVLALTHSATVRLADDLERRGFLTRQPGVDRRLVGLTLTDKGLAVRAAVMRARSDVLEEALSALEADDRSLFERCVTRVLLRLTISRRAADHICRLCDEAACGRDECPVERRAAELDAT